jgi:catechol 2,3-dioxygenase-like lactoylglutathione lyase family enzyme
MIEISGVNHLTFSCRNLEVSFDFYKNLLGFRPLVKWERGAYLLVGEMWVCLSLDPEFSPQKSKGHTAFTIKQSDFEAMKKRLISAKAMEWTQNTSEGDSFYFLDPDGNQLEIHVGDWRSRLESLKKNPYPGKIEFF